MSVTQFAKEYSLQRKQLADDLRKRGIRDEKVLAALEAVPRHLFVEKPMVHNAYIDRALPIESGQTISQPFIVARMTELLEITAEGNALEIGAGSGFQTAVLAQLAGRVYAIERIPELAQVAQQRLNQLGIHNATVKCFDGTVGWKEYAPYQAILVAAGSPEIPQALINQLAIGGRIVIPVGDDKNQRLIRGTRAQTGLKQEDFGACSFVKLIGRYGWAK